MKKLKIILGPNSPRPLVLTFSTSPSPVLTFASHEDGYNCLLITSNNDETLTYVKEKLNELKFNSQNDCVSTLVNIDPGLGTTYAVFGDYCILNK